MAPDVVLAGVRMPGNLLNRVLGRVFSADKAIDSRALNLVGVQVFRTLAARTIFNLRTAPVEKVVRTEVEKLRREGILIMPEFLPEAQFERVRRECLEVLESERDKINVLEFGANTLERLDVRLFEQRRLPATNETINDHRLNAILIAAERSTRIPELGMRTIECLTQGPLDSGVDALTELHSDIFFDTHKVWLYLEDVQQEHGPFVYVPRSRQLKIELLKSIYRGALGLDPGFRRVSREELAQCGLREMIVTCRKNTLVIANTFGFHGRLRGQPGRKRYALHMNLRRHPFNLNETRSYGNCAFFESGCNQRSGFL